MMDQCKNRIPWGGAIFMGITYATNIGQTWMATELSSFDYDSPGGAW